MDGFPELESDSVINATLLTVLLYLQKDRASILRAILHDRVSPASLDNLDLEVKKFTASIQQMEEEIANQNRGNQDKEDGYRVKKRTLDLLPDAENNIAKLQVN